MRVWLRRLLGLQKTLKDEHQDNCHTEECACDQQRRIEEQKRATERKRALDEDIAMIRYQQRIQRRDV